MHIVCVTCFVSRQSLLSCLHFRPRANVDLDVTSYSSFVFPAMLKTKVVLTSHWRGNAWKGWYLSLREYLRHRLVDADRFGPQAAPLSCIAKPGLPRLVMCDESFRGDPLIYEPPIVEGKSPICVVTKGSLWMLIIAGIESILCGLFHLVFFAPIYEKDVSEVM